MSKEPSAETKRLLAQLAQRAGQISGLMASIMTRYKQLEHLNDDELALILQTDALGLARLALSKRPSPDEHFAGQTEQIASYSSTDAVKLAQLIRYVDSMDALAQKPAVAAVAESTEQFIPKVSGVVAAARDRDPGDEENEADDVAGSREPNSD